jgi:hypothetical protein
MRWLVVLALVGCGRIGFAPIASAVDGGGDGRPADDGMAPTVDTIALVCPAGYDSVAGGCYHDPQNGGTWTAAEAQCEADGVGHLVIFDDQNELDALRGYAGGVVFWIGVTDRITPGSYLTVTGSVASFLPWSPGEPTGGSQNCLVSYLQFLPANPFVDESCTVASMTWCEFDGKPADPSSY